MAQIQEVSIIIPTMPGREALLRRLLLSLPSGCEKIIVNNDDMLLAAKRNHGADLSKGKYLLFIDDDNYVKAGAVESMVDSFDEEIGVMGMVACYDDKKMRVADGGSDRNYLTGFTYGNFTNWTRAELPEGIYHVDEVANAFMIRRDVFEESGGFDEKNFPIDLDEADLCKRIKDMGYDIVMNPHAICYHKSQTYSPIPNFRRPMNAYFMGRNRVLYQRKHLDALSYCVHAVFFMPVFFLYYVGSLLWKKNPSMIWPFTKGVLDGLRGCFENQYQKR